MKMSAFLATNDVCETVLRALKENTVTLGVHHELTYHSVILLGVADENCCFLLIIVGLYR
jgi:hypothetical protein